ncbi:hypothetical protein HID58_006766 [Brassica napus]|uniref:Uncharacterized protein n=1 Tax=Brassica napus TaxID=3708 RepID=A0ABQ8ECC5_BRANA|nr:hypothetical protein HID58_006766 [Brassica napus]
MRMFPHFVSSFGTMSSQTGNSQRPSLSIRCLWCQSTNTKEPKSSCNILDNASNLFTNMLSGGSFGSMATAEGAVSDLFGKPLFLSLYDYMEEFTNLRLVQRYLLSSLILLLRHVLRENAFSYDKGVLAEILEPVMGKGLIPADLDTWNYNSCVPCIVFGGHGQSIQQLF